MRGLVSAALVLAPAFASVLVREADFDHGRDREVIRPDIDGIFTHIKVKIPEDPTSPDEWTNAPLILGLQVSRSESACGYGNVTLNGQELPQTLNGDVSEGSGTFAVNRKTVVASWSFHCIKVNGVPDSQFLKFVVDFVDRRALQNVGFSTLFRQSESMAFINIETDLSIPDQIAANPNPDALQPVDQDVDFPQYSVENDIDELRWMRAQLRELEYLIYEKEQAIRQHAAHHFEEEIEDCDNLKCIIKTVAEKARNAAHHLYGKIRGDYEEYDEEDEEFNDKPHFKKPHFPKPPFKKPHFPKPPFHGGKNHTGGPPKGNHTHPRKPHFPHHPLPICRYPPPPHHGKPPHGHPPGPPPAWAHRPDFHHGPDMDDEPPRHFGGHRKPPPGQDFDGPPNGEGHHGPPPPEFDGPHHGEGDHGLPPPDFDGPPHDGDDHRPPPPPPEFQQEHIGPPGDRHHEHPPFDGPPNGPPHGPGRNGIGKVFQVIKFTAIGFVFAFLIIALHRRACTPKRHADRAARREARHRRRAYRRAAHKHAITRLLARISGNESDSEDDYEEKCQALLADAEDGMSTTMTEDITQLRNAAEIVGDIVSAEEGRSQTVEPTSITVLETRPLMQDFEIGSQVGDGEELPAYEDNDGSEASSFVADGFRYTPGGSEYSPSHSPAGSVSDILGPDTKS